MNPPSENSVFIRILSRLLETIGALLLFSMMMLTFVDVIARYFFSRSITGGFEVTEIMLATLIFCGLPLITLRNGHITVDLIENYLPAGFRHVRDRFVYLMVGIMLAFLGYRLWLKGNDFVEYNDQTAVLLIPLAPICYIMAALCFVSAAISVYFALSGHRAQPATPDKSSTNHAPAAGEHRS